MKKIILIGLICSMFLVSGCGDKATMFAYFNMDEGCKEDCMGSCERQEKCDSICEESGIRIQELNNNHHVTFKDGNFICECS